MTLEKVLETYLKRYLILRIILKKNESLPQVKSILEDIPKR